MLPEADLGTSPLRFAICDREGWWYGAALTNKLVGHLRHNVFQTLTISFLVVEIDDCNTYRAICFVGSLEMVEYD